jgi:sulfate permease, SulP family
MGTAPPEKVTSSKLSSVIAFIPALVELKTYSFGKFRLDLFAGLTVAAVAVPQAMAYATIFGMPVQYGLYTAIVMTAVGSLLNGSRHLINGPTNAISIAMLSALAIVPEGDRIAAAFMMSLMIGVIQVSITLFRLGDLSRYISSAVIVGFTCGASVLLLLDQLKNLLGLDYKADMRAPFIKRFYETILYSGPIHWPTVMLAALTIAVVLIFRWINRTWNIRLPDLLLGISVAGFVVWAMELNSPTSGVALIGKVPSTMPSFQLPKLDWSLISGLSSSALALSFLGLLEAIAMAKSLAAKSGQKLDINQQCLSEGAANIAGSFFQCFPGSGSLTRSFINYTAGAVTQWSGVISALGVAATMMALAPYAAYIPKSSLAGVLVLTALRMVELAAVRFHWKATKFDRIIFLATALSAVFVSIEFCILIGVLLSFLLYVPRAARIWMSELTITAEGKVRELKSNDSRCEYFRIYNLEGELFFGCAPQFERMLEQITEATNQNVAVILLRTKRLHNPDAMCLEILQKWVKEKRSQGTIVLLSGVRPELQRSLGNLGIDKLIGSENIFPETQELYFSTIQAMQRGYDILSNRRCQNCPKQLPGVQWSYEI